MKNKKGFLVFISIMVSIILASIGIFLSTIMSQELKLSSSLKESQKAFYAADSALECALFKEFKTNGFGNYPLRTHNIENSLNCNGINFDWFSTTDLGNNTTLHIYYITLGPAVDSNNDGFITRDEIRNTPNSGKYPYIKLKVYKKQNIDSLAPGEWSTKIQAYGLNKRLGYGRIERAIEISY